MPTFEELKAMASPAETSVRLVLAGQYVEEIRQLEQKLADAPAPVSLGDTARRDIAERIEALLQKMRDSEVEFKLRAMPGKAWNQIKLGQPIRQEGQSKEDAIDAVFDWFCKLVAQSSLDPKLTADQVAELCDMMPGSAWDELTEAAWAVNSGKVSVPFSAIASALTQTSDATSKLLSDVASPIANSGGSRGRRQPATSTTKPAG